MKNVKIMTRIIFIVSAAALLICQVAGQQRQCSRPRDGGVLPVEADQLRCSLPAAGFRLAALDPLIYADCARYVSGASLPIAFDYCGCTTPGGATNIHCWDDCYSPDGRVPPGIHVLWRNLGQICNNIRYEGGHLYLLENGRKYCLTCKPAQHPVQGGSNSPYPISGHYQTENNLYPYPNESGLIGSNPVGNSVQNQPIGQNCEQAGIEAVKQHLGTCSRNYRDGLLRLLVETRNAVSQTHGDRKDVIISSIERDINDAMNKIPDQNDKDRWRAFLDKAPEEIEIVLVQIAGSLREAGVAHDEIITRARGDLRKQLDSCRSELVRIENQPRKC